MSARLTSQENSLKASPSPITSDRREHEDEPHGGVAGMIFAKFDCDTLDASIEEYRR